MRTKEKKINLKSSSFKGRDFGGGKKFLIAIFAALVVGCGSYFLSRNLINAISFFVGIFVLVNVAFFVRKNMQKYAEIKKMEEVFPDFISLVSSNLRAGMTIDQALLLSSRDEFAPLDAEILKLGKDIVTGHEITAAMKDMGERIKSEEIRKTILLITSGIQSGGNLSVLLEETSSNVRERNFVRKRAASNVLMYVIFIFFAVAFGAPVLFGLSSVLVEILSGILSQLPSQQVNLNLPFAFSQISIPLSFIFYFSIIFVVVTDVLASLVLGLVSKGEERDGFRYIVPLIAISLTVFFVARIILLKYFSGVFG